MTDTDSHVHMYTCLHVHMYTCLHVHMYTRLHVHTYISTGSWHIDICTVDITIRRTPHTTHTALEGRTYILYTHTHCKVVVLRLRCDTYVHYGSSKVTGSPSKKQTGQQSKSGFHLRKFNSSEHPLTKHSTREAPEVPTSLVNTVQDR